MASTPLEGQEVRPVTISGTAADALKRAERSGTFVDGVLLDTDSEKSRVRLGIDGRGLIGRSAEKLCAEKVRRLRNTLKVPKSN